ncbi:MAG: type I restriction endonuclease subunit R [Aureispira sp.]
MAHQSEQVLENKLLAQLAQQGYALVAIRDESSLLDNLKVQLEAFNGVQLSAQEFKQALNHLNKGNVFDRAKILRDRVTITRDNGEALYLSFINQQDWSKNQYQVTQQVTVQGSYKNRYDVTILVNGLPLVQIELKRRGLELKEAFKQIKRYHRHSYGASYGLFLYVQIFVISNGVNTKYYANNKRQSFKQTFYWADKENKGIHDLTAFTQQFLERSHLSKMLTQYIVLNEGLKILMVLRPYQYYATEAIVHQVKTQQTGGYIWHTTGSGKTLTSFKASQLIVQLPHVDKVVFVVDRKDLDYQTMKEFNYFAKGSVDATDNTKLLIDQFTDQYKDKKGTPKVTKLILTTIQKLNNAIFKNKYKKRMEPLRQQNIVFIFDECHRSQFGKTHLRINDFFQQNQLFGFTGTPIFAKNAIKNELGKRTTKELFGECLHKYVITDAIKDDNVLKFGVEYVGKYKQKASNNEIDIEVEAIDTKELLESSDRLEKIVDYIIAYHATKTKSKTYNALFCVSNIKMLIQYYDLFKRKKEAGEHNLKIGTIFSYTPNEDDDDADGFYEYGYAAEPEPSYKTSHSRDKLEEYIADYNALFQTKYNTKDNQAFYNYYKELSLRVKKRELDILLVVDMFLTGFDSPALNTLYVDKSLKHHGLIQAYSRTNRLVGDQKTQGNIVCFRNLKKATDEAIALFSDKNAVEVIFAPPYEQWVEKFNEAAEELKAITPDLEAVDALYSEDDILAFVKAFRQLIRAKNAMNTHADFDFDDLAMSEQEFEDFKSKYLDIYTKVKQEKEKASILDDVDFELELIHRDEINVAYILRLLAELQKAAPKDKDQQQKAIIDLLMGEVQLRSKKALIEKFILENLPNLSDSNDIPAAFEVFWDTERRQAFADLCREEALKPQKLQEVIDTYLFTQREPLRDTLIKTLENKPKLLERKKTATRILDKVMAFVACFFDDI